MVYKREQGTGNREQENSHASFARSADASRGFTLVELIVTVGIFALVSASIIARNAQFDEQVLLNDMAYDMALSIRRAQNYGINVRGSEGAFDRPYGIFFESGTTTYAFFSDTDGDDTYDEPEELLETFMLGRGAMVSQLCDLDGGDCNPTKDLTVLFKRPDPDAWIFDSGGQQIGRARVELTSARGGYRAIGIESTGQLSIQGVEEEEE